MTMMRRPPGPSFIPRQPRHGGDGRPVLAVGGRGLVNGPSQGGVVVLSDEHGVPTGMSVPHDGEVEIVAWRPRGSNGARYRVRAIADGVEGWLDAPSIRARPVPPAPKRPVVVPAAPPPRARVSARPKRGSR